MGSSTVQCWAQGLTDCKSEHSETLAAIVIIYHSKTLSRRHVQQMVNTWSTQHPVNMTTVEAALYLQDAWPCPADSNGPLAWAWPRRALPCDSGSSFFLQVKDVGSVALMWPAATFPILQRKQVQKKKWQLTQRMLRAEERAGGTWVQVVAGPEAWLHFCLSNPFEVLWARNFFFGPSYFKLPRVAKRVLTTPH